MLLEVNKCFLHFMDVFSVHVMQLKRQNIPISVRDSLVRYTPMLSVLSFMPPNAAYQFNVTYQHIERTPAIVKFCLLCVL